GNLQPGQRARERQTKQAVLDRQRSPERPLIAPPDVPLEVQPPRLHRAGRVPDAAEGNGELGAPANVAGLRTHDPRGVPVQVEATARTGLLVEAGPRAAAAAHHARALTLVCDLPVVLEPGRVGAEHEAVLPVLVRVDDDLEAVDVGEGRITPRIAEHDP